ncbi:MAG: hypothetical protein PHV93_04550 [Candidatus Pacebacteria bacterium]|nr:hypothetical protein [Candidatus Paceibacterota bacterium]
MPKILHIVVRKCWFDLMDNGYKRVEYRLVKPYWTRILMEKDCKTFKKFDEVHIRNGYGGKKILKFKHSATIKQVTDYPETGKREFLYVIGLGERIDKVEVKK